MAIEELLTAPLSLSLARAQLGLSKTELARKAGVNRATIDWAEKGKALRRETAYKILNALNVERHRQLKPRLDIEQLTWKVRP